MTHDICNLRKTNSLFTSFKDNVIIDPLSHKLSSYNLESTLSEIKDQFCCNKFIVSDDIKHNFALMFDNYGIMIKEIMEINKNQLNAEYDYNIITTANNDTYDIFSPKYIIDLYDKLYNENLNDLAVHNQLKNDYKNAKKYYKIFYKKYRAQMVQFVLYGPENIELLDEYYINFTNNLLILILEFCNNMIKINVYAIPQLVNNVITEHSCSDALMLPNTIVL